MIGRTNKLGKWTDDDGEEGTDDSENDYGEDSDGSSRPSSLTLISSLCVALLSLMFLCSFSDSILLLWHQNIWEKVLQIDFELTSNSNSAF